MPDEDEIETEIASLEIAREWNIPSVDGFSIGIAEDLRQHIPGLPYCCPSNRGISEMTSPQNLLLSREAIMAKINATVLALLLPLCMAVPRIGARSRLKL